MALDILIKNGWIIDGLGTSMFQADIGVSDGQITKIGILGSPEARLVIDAQDHYVSPGFIDITNASDRYLTLLNHPRMESFLYQGVTTIIGGNCGSSLAPLVSGNTIISVQKWGDVDQVNVNWLTLKEFLEHLEKQKTALNFGTLVGHTTLRRGLAGDEFRDLDEREISEAVDLLTRSLKEGGLGLSFGLTYSHAKVASKLEIDSLAGAASGLKKIISMHLRDESKNLISSVEEAVEVARNHGAALEIAHLKAVGQDSELNFVRALNLVNQAESEGLDVNFDVYPYTTTATVLYTFLPDWIAFGGRRRLIENLRNSGLRERAVAEMQQSKIENLDKLVIASGHLDKTIIGKTIGNIAQNSNISIEEAVVNVLLAAEGKAVVFWPSQEPSNIEKALQSPISIVASDAPVHSESDAKTGFLAHPRSFGTFPRILAHYVREKKIISWEEAIKKMTALPALKLGIKDRGVLRKGHKADITVFHPDKIKDNATFENPYQYSQGVKAVIVNGKTALLDGEIQPALFGQILR